MRILLIAVLLLTACSAVSAKWDSNDDKLLLHSSLLICADWAQTRSLAISTRSFIGVDGSEGTITTYGTECNPLIGRHPTMGRVDTYFISALVLNAACLRLLSDKDREKYGKAVITLEIATVGRNLALGIGMKF